MTEQRELTTEEWRAEKKRKKALMAAMQALPYEVKVKRAELRAREYIEKLDDMGLEAHVSVGGLDSIVLLCFLRSIGIDVPKAYANKAEFSRKWNEVRYALIMGLRMEWIDEWNETRARILAVKQ